VNCAKCSTQAGCDPLLLAAGRRFFFQDNEEAPTIDVTIASLDQPEHYAPEVAIWTEDRLPWARLDAALQAFQRGRNTGVPPV
jgi:hypothetical protein